MYPHVNTRIEVSRPSNRLRLYRFYRSKYTDPEPITVKTTEEPRRRVPEREVCQKVTSYQTGFMKCTVDRRCFHYWFKGSEPLKCSSEGNVRWLFSSMYWSGLSHRVQTYPSCSFLTPVEIWRYKTVLVKCKNKKLVVRRSNEHRNLCLNEDRPDRKRKGKDNRNNQWNNLMKRSKNLEVSLVSNLYPLLEPVPSGEVRSR